MTLREIDILVYAENGRLLRELLTKAQKAAPGKVGAAVFGQTHQASHDFGQWGADATFLVEDTALAVFNPEIYTQALCEVIRKIDPALVLVGGTKQGLELSARVGERLNLGIASWCVEFELDQNSKEVTAQCMIYSGVGLNTYKVKSRPALATVAGRVFEFEDFEGKQAEVVELLVPLSEPRMQVIDEQEKMAPGLRLEDAQVIVDAGQGFEKREDLVLAEDLARFFAGQVSCTRPLSSERDWFPEWIGLSGSQVSPQLCFTIGVSGAIQHMIGIRNSAVIVAVNNDENAGIHWQADYGVVADLYEFIPAFLKVLNERSITLG